MNDPIAETSKPNPRLGYACAALNAVISGFAIYLNGKGVTMFADSTVYTTLKNSVVGIALLAPLLLVTQQRDTWRHLGPRQWGLLLALAIIGGSVPYALFFRGLQLTTPVTGSLLNHAQFLLVALLAVMVLGERAGPLLWGALLVLLVGTELGMDVHIVRWNEGALLIVLSTVLFAAGVVLSKYLLAQLPTLTVMTAKMSIGSGMLLLYLAVTGRLGGVTQFSATQWHYILGTGLVLLAFTVTAFLALRNVSATTATAIPAVAPVITTALVSLDTHRIALSPVAGLGIVLMVAATTAVFAISHRQQIQLTQRHRTLVPA